MNIALDASVAIKLYVLEDMHDAARRLVAEADTVFAPDRSEEHTSELQSRRNLVCRLLLEKKNKTKTFTLPTNTRVHARILSTFD